MKVIDGYFLIKPDDLAWRPSNTMRIPNADFLERTGSQNLGARLWRLPPGSANTLHKHILAEEFYFVIEGTGRIRVGDEAVTVPKHGGILVGPQVLRQVFNDTDADALWLIVSAPDAEFEPGKSPDLSEIYPVEPTQLPKELAGHEWPPK
jgi:mannose-6-phosphate isomerase-like protein (cupin superfamily)